MLVGDLFAGIGGFSLGLERAGMQTAWQVENEPFCIKVLEKHWPDVPRMEDITDVTDPMRQLGPVDLVCGGFPCQGISAAGRGAGMRDERSSLWWWMFYVIDSIRPRWVIIENSPVLRTRGSDRVLASLEGAGYTCWPVVVGAWAVGAPHKRDRVWIVGHAERDRRNKSCGDLGAVEATQRREESEEPQPQRTTKTTAINGLMVAHRPRQLRQQRADGDGTRQRSWELVNPNEQRCDESKRKATEPENAIADGTNEGMADASDTGLEGQGNGEGGSGAKESMLASPCGHGWPARPGEAQHGWEPERLTQFGMGGTTDGLPAGLVRARRQANKQALKAYGNAVVPQVVEAIGRSILQTDEITQGATYGYGNSTQSGFDSKRH